MHGRVPRWRNLMQLLAGTVILVACIGLQLPARAAGEAVELLGFEITFLGHDYDPIANETKYTYRIQGNYSGSHNLNYWILALCGGTEVNAHIIAEENGLPKSSHDEVEPVFGDPFNYGIRFNVEVDSHGGDTTVWFVLIGNWEVGPVDVSLTAGPMSASTQLLGPTCNSFMCYLNYTISHGRTDFRIMRPGDYATVMAQIELSGTSGAKLQFSDFEHAQSLDHLAAPPVLLAYSLGETLADADAYGWLSAQDINRVPIEFTFEEIRNGKFVTLWVRAKVEYNHYPFEYQTAGTISITPICP